MGEYLTIFHKIQESIYENDFSLAYLKLQTLLNLMNSDYKKTTNKKEKDILATTIKKFLPTLQNLKQNTLTDNDISILKLDIDKIQNKETNISTSLDDDLENEENSQLEIVNTQNTEQQNIDENFYAKASIKDNKKLMPLTFDDYIGQEKAKQTLKIAICAAKKEHRALNHLLICSSYGIGKTTLANIIANEMDLPFIEINASSLKDSKALLKFFEGINKPCIIFIDEIHNLSNDNQTILLSILSQYKFSTIDKNGNSKTIELPSFTLIGASTQIGELLKPFINRFTILELQDYTEEEQIKIVASKLNIINLTYDDEAIKDISIRSRGIPRNMETFIKGIKDLCLSLNVTHVNKNITQQYFSMYEIDEKGLYARDRDILRILNEQDKPIGLLTLESKLGIQKEDIEYRYEPYLIKIHFIEKTEKGRIITQLGKEYLSSIKN